MAQVLNPQSGQIEDVPDDQVTAIVSSGKGLLPKGQVRVVAPDGKTGTIPEEDAADAFSNGYRFETGAERQATADQAKFGNRPVAAALAGAARGLSFGLSDPLLTQSGLAKPETLKGVAEHNKAASVVGEVATALAPGGGLLGGAARAAEGLVARKVGEGFLRAGARHALGGVATGGLMGLGSTISEASLGDADLTAEKLVGGIGLGALTGGVLGGGISLLGTGAGALTKGIAPKLGAITADLRGSLKEFAERRAVKAVAGNGHLGALRALDNKGVINDVGRFALDEGILTAGATADDIAQRAASSVQKHGQRIGAALDAADAHLAAAGTPAVIGADIADKIENDLVAPLRNGNVGDQAVADRLQKEADFVRNKGSLGFREANDLKRSFDKFLDFGVEQKPVQENLKRIRGIINSDIESQMGKVQGLPPELTGEFKAAKKAFGLSSELNDLAQERVLQLRNNRSFSITDYGLGGIGATLAGGPAGLLTGAASAVGNKMLRERGPQALAVALDHLADSGVIGRVSKAFSANLGAKLKAMPAMFEGFGETLTQAAARGADDLLATHVSLHNADPAYRAVMARAGFPDESPDQAQAAMRRAGQLDLIHAQVDAQDAKSNAAVARFFGEQSGAAPRDEVSNASRDERLKAYEARVRNLETLAREPELMTQALQPGPMIAGVAPGIAMAATATASRALQFLNSKAPRNPYPEVIPALARPWNPSDYELGRWERYARAVDDPQSVLADLKRGTVQAESIETLRAVYPKLLEDIQARMMERLSGYQGVVTPEQRQALGTLFGQPVGVSGTTNIAVFQAAHAAAAVAEGQKQQAAAAHSQAKKNGSTTSLATASQRIEGR